MSERDDGVLDVRNFGLPLTGRGPRALLQRVVAKVLWPFLKVQIEHNRLMEENLKTLRRFTESIDARRHADQRDLGERIGRMAAHLTPGEFSSTPIVSTAAKVELDTWSAFDSIAVAFSERFRGSWEVIQSRLEVYLPNLGKVSSLGPVCDIGCGRGELLDLLRTAGIPAYGIDTDSDFVEQCDSRKLDARHVDALQHLETVKEGSLGAITMMHVVEHLPVGVLLEFLRLSFRALAPGGLIIMETPNGSNVLVGSNNFYLDPTHIRPVPAEFLQFVTETSGFVDSQIVLHRRVRDRFAVNPHTGEAWSREVHQALSMVEDTLLGAEDYAVVARRP